MTKYFDLGLTWTHLDSLGLIMGAPVDAVGVSARRAELTGNKVGWRGLVSSKKTFGIALFASLGGLVYGCT